MVVEQILFCLYFKVFMTLEKLEFWDNIVSGAIILSLSIAGFIGTFYNQEMIDKAIEAQRELIASNKKWERFRYWIKMHRGAWKGYVGCTIFALIMLLIQHSLDSSIKKAETIEKQHRDSSLRSEYFAQIILMQNENANERREVRLENQKEREALLSANKSESDQIKEQADRNLKDITGNMAKEFAENYSANEKEHKITQNSLSEIKTKQTGVISINPGLDYVRFDTVGDNVYVSPIICNYGNIPAKNVHIEVWELKKTNLLEREKVNEVLTDMPNGQDYCLLMRYRRSIIPDIRGVYLCFKIMYKDSKGTDIEEYSGIFYSFDLKGWGMSNADFKYVFSIKK